MKRLAALLLGAAAAVAQAQHVEHAFLTVSGGATAVQTTCLNGRDACSLSSSGGRVLGGLFYQPGLAVEIVFMDFGRGRETRGADTQRVGLRMLGLGSAAVMELGGGLAFTARAGLAGTRLRRESTVALSDSLRLESSVELYAGFSALFRLHRALGVEVSVDALGLGDSTYRRDGGLMASVGLSLRY